MKVHAKCHNYAGCLVAYRGDEIELADGAPMVCPECGKPLTVSKGGGGLGKTLPLVIGIVLIGGGAFVAAPMLSKMFRSDDPAKPPKGGEVTGGGTTPAVTPGGSNASTAPEPPQKVTAVQNIDLNVDREENKAVKEDVLKRIDLMPNISASNKDKLYNSVERAREMGKVVTVPFTSGKMTLSAGDIQGLKTELERPEIIKLREDPTAVFVVLGYADAKGDPKKNLAISQARADAVLETMRDKAGVSNVMHAVAMGGSNIVDAKDLEKNRVVEIWAVLP